MLTRSNILNKAKKVLINKPLHTFLLPLLFILNVYFQYAGLISVKTSYVLFIIIFFVTLMFLFSVNIFFKNIVKSGIYTTITGILFLYFGNIKKGFAATPVLHVLSHYTFFLPVVLFLWIFSLYKITRAKSISKFNIYINVLFVSYFFLIFFDGINFINTKHAKTVLQKDSVQVKARDKEGKPGYLPLPDIYFIMPDCYPSSSYQAEMLNHNNAYFDSTLALAGFYVSPRSTSNYNRTQFSIPSTLNMEYLASIDTTFSSKALEYSKALEQTKNNTLITFLKKNNYQFINLSIFDIGDSPAFTRESFIKASENDIILNNTFGGCYKRDLSPKLFKPVYSQDYNFNLSKIEHYRIYGVHNKKVIDSLYEITLDTGNIISPKIVYAHLYLPHYPYLYDSVGKAYPDKDVFNDSAYVDKKMFKGYIQYTNSKLLQIVKNILSAHERKDIVIILQSDHGFDDIDTSRPQDAFRNYKAIYFSDKDYSMLYDSMSNVNTFRVVLNKYFMQHLPMLKDSSFYLK